MPLATFVCPTCGREEQRIVKHDTQGVPCRCGETMHRQLPKKISASSYETRDARRGVQVRKGVEKELKKRMRDHHDRYEVEEKIDKHGTDDMQKLGWDKRRKI